MIEMELMSYEALMEWMMILGVINVVLCGLMLAFGFRQPKTESEFKPIEFDWKQEGF